MKTSKAERRKSLRFFYILENCPEKLELSVSGFRLLGSAGWVAEEDFCGGAVGGVGQLQEVFAFG